MVAMVGVAESVVSKDGNGEESQKKRIYNVSSSTFLTYLSDLDVTEDLFSDPLGRKPPCRPVKTVKRGRDAAMDVSRSAGSAHG